MTEVLARATIDTGQDRFNLWKKIRDVFKKGGSAAQPAESAMGEGTKDEPLQSAAALLNAVLMARQGEQDPNDIIAQLRVVTNSRSVTADARAFALFCIGELYLQLETPEVAKAREAFCELIDSDSKEDPWRLRGLIFRAGIDCESTEPSVVRHALQDLDRALRSPLLGDIEEIYVCRTYCFRAIAYKNLGNSSQAVSDFQRVIDSPSCDTPLRIVAFTLKANVFALQGRWLDEAEACLGSR